MHATPKGYKKILSLAEALPFMRLIKVFLLPANQLVFALTP
jgi:hypothetical protein